MGMDPDAKDDDDKTAFDFIKTIYRNPPPMASFLSSLPKLKKKLNNTTKNKKKRPISFFLFKKFDLFKFF